MTLAIKWFLFMIFILAEDDCTEANFTIASGHLGYVHHYGIFGNFDLLGYSKTQPPAYFCITNNLALKELESGKCVGIISKTNKQIILTNNCKEQWRYNHENETLIAIKYPANCFGPWEYTAKQPEIKYVPGLSPCAHWNHVFLNPTLCPKQTTTMKSRNTVPFMRSSTKGQSSDTNSSNMWINNDLYIVIPTALLSLVIVLILFVHCNRAADIKSSEKEHDRDTESQHNDKPTLTDADVYTELDQNREPGDSYMSLVLYENPDECCDSSFVTGENANNEAP